MIDPKNSSDTLWRDEVPIEPEATKEADKSPQLPPKDEPYHHFGYVADNWSEASR